LRICSGFGSPRVSKDGKRREVGELASFGTEKLIDLAAFADEVGVDGVDEKNDWKPL